MLQDRSREALKEFLDWTGDKGLMPRATVHGRKAAANMILEILSEDEARDVTALDLDGLMQRFSNLKGKNYSTGSLRSYQSRLGKALDDFSTYVDNPLAFKPSGGKRKTTDSKETSRPATKQSAPPAQALISASPLPSAYVIPIPLRSDLIVHVQGIPFDLNRSEAQRIANVILALSRDDP